MLSKFFANFHGSHSASPMAKAAIGCTTLAMLGMTSGAVSASVIYLDNFPGSSSAALNGTTPATDTGGAKWTADTPWMANGSVGANAGWDNAYLPFAPTSGQIYTLSEGISVTAGAANTTAEYDFIGLAFLQSGVLGQPLWLNSTGGANAGPWVQHGVPGSGGNEITPYTGPGNAGGTGAYSFQGTGVQNLQMVLNTANANWTVQFSDNGTALGAVYTYATNPTIADVGFGTLSAIGQVSNFELTSAPAPVPEPATLGLFAIGGAVAGALMLKRHRRAV